MSTTVVGTPVKPILREILEGLAAMQAQHRELAEPAEASPPWQAEPKLQVQNGQAFETLLDLLIGESNNTPESGFTSVGKLLGRRQARFFHNALSRRSALLQPLIEKARTLTGTYAHLHLTPDMLSSEPGNISSFSPKTGVFGIGPFGPAALRMHRLFRSCSQVVNILVRATDSDASEDEILAVAAYRKQLSANAFADADELQEALVGGVCLGLVHEIIDIVQLRTDSKRHSRKQSTALESALFDLLDSCDTLALRSQSSTLDCATDYFEQNQLHRARQLLQRYLQRKPEDVDVLVLLAQVLEADLDLSGAINLYSTACERRPDDWTLSRDLGIALLGKLRYAEAISCLRRAIGQAPGDPELAAEIERAETLQKWLTDARHADAMPTIAACEAEREEGQFREETLALAEHLYRKHGTLLIENVYDTAMINDCKAQFLNDYKAYLGDQKQPDALQIGHRRFQVSIALQGAFNQPDFYANTFVLSIMQRLIGRKVIIGSTVCASSLPGAKDQHWHKDHRALFTADEHEDPIDIPPVSITTMIPLVPLDEKIGTTLVKKGSHRWGTAASEELASQVPLASPGSCFLMDFALSHRGQANQTDQVRPIINMVYHQRWFVDNKNFRGQPPLQIDAAEYEKIPKRHRRLFDWCIQPGPQVGC